MTIGQKISTITALSCMFLGAAHGIFRITQEMIVYTAGARFTDEFGGEIASEELNATAQLALSTMGVTLSPFIHVYETEGISCAASWHMWLNKRPSLGPWKFVVFHEAGHIACGHFDERFLGAVYDERAREQEKEADLKACEALHARGMDDIILDRLAQIKRAIDMNLEETDLGDHPSLQEMYDYMQEFCEKNQIA